MAAVNSQMLPLGTRAPAFRLPDTDGRLVSLEDHAGAAGHLVMFICNHCPFVVHVAEQLAAIGREYGERGIAVYAISSNDVDAYPADSPAAMAQEKVRRGYVFPYLYDASQEVAKAYRAACTPDLYLFDADLVLVYRGQLDASRPTNGVPVTGHDLRRALERLLAGEPPVADQTPSIGCRIKWKPGNEPEWFG